MRQHLDRVVVHVEMVVFALRDAMQRRQLRQHDVGCAELLHQREPGDHASLGEDLLHSVKTRSDATPRRPQAAARAARAVCARS